MYLMTSGFLAREHIRDLHREAAEHRHGRRWHQAIRALARRTQLGPVYNYRTR